MSLTQESVSRDVREKIRSAGLWRVPGTSGESERTHLISPEPFWLTPAQVNVLERLGTALLAFYTAVNDIYLRSDLDWVRDYLDIGKDDEIIRHASMKYQKRALPGVIRPDILITDGGFAITELDSVPGGIGHLDCLSSAYADAGCDLIGSSRGMRDGFAWMLREAAASENPVCAIVVSDESIDYLPEMQHLASELRDSGLRAYTVRPQELIFTEDGLFIDAQGERLRVDVIYRFFELFDLLNIPKSELIAYAAKKKLVTITPPYKHFLEEKLLLALLHHEALAKYWQSELGEDNFALLRETVTPTYILDSRPVPPHAAISGFKWRGEPVRDWRVIKDGTQKERQLVIKPSGYSPLAWGSRGVKIGHDMSQEEWAECVDNALSSYNTSPHVLQPFQATSVIGVKYLKENQEMGEMNARVRLCPYYFANGTEVRLGGVLATAVNQNKKLVHGTSEAVMCPCAMQKAG